MRSVQFSINWKLTLFTAFFLPLLISLGFWQLERAEEKRTILENWAGQQAADQSRDEHTPPSIAALSTKPDIDGTLVRFEATLDESHYWLQEGKLFQGRPGYIVLMRATTTQGENLVVNRGWVAANPDRRILPTIPLIASPQQFQGRARKPSKAPMTSESSNPLQTWPHRILEIELDILSDQAGVSLAPFIVDLSADNPYAFTVIPRQIAVSPEKHQGYAFQWFMMAATLVILWLVANSNIASLLGFTSNMNNKKKHD